MRRKMEGAKIAEMKQVGCIAFSRFRYFAYEALIYSDCDVRRMKGAKGI